MSSLDLTSAFASDVGCVRESNEDFGAVIVPEDHRELERKGTLAIMCDGLGGHVSGEVASGLAVSVISREFYRSEKAPPESLIDSVLEANREVYAISLSNPSFRGMGTTCTACAIHGDKLYCAQIGDSRLYLVREELPYLLSEDHSMVMQMVRQGLITADQARKHNERNVILRALGRHSQVDVSSWERPFPLKSGDHLILCTDGLYDLVEDEEIAETALKTEPEAACRQLVASARERGGYDNVSVAIIRCTARA